MSRFKIKKHCYLSVKDPSSDLKTIYNRLEIDYPKFFKMDNLSKIGFLSTEILLKDESQRFVSREDIAIIGFNSSASLDTDRSYQKTIQQSDDFFPSPSVFVYTLPNIVLGEIAIRNSLFAETFFYVCQRFEAKFISQTVIDTFEDAQINGIIVLWVEVNEAFAAFIERK